MYHWMGSVKKGFPAIATSGKIGESHLIEYKINYMNSSFPIYFDHINREFSQILFLVNIYIGAGTFLNLPCLNG